MTPSTTRWICTRLGAVAVFTATACSRSSTDHVTAGQPTVAIDTPAADTLLTVSTVSVSGAAGSDALSVRVNGVDGLIEGERFTVDGVVLREGENILAASATGAKGDTASTSVRVWRDTVAPSIGITWPKVGSVLYGPTTTVAGSVYDLIGSLSGYPVSVVVGTVTAEVAGGEFIARNVPLEAGVQTLTAVARDAAGNTRSASVSVAVVVATGSRLMAISGDGQRATVGATLPAPLVVALLDANNELVAGRQVHFVVERGDGRLNGSRADINITTDAAGIAEVTLEVGARSGAAANLVRATAVGFSGEAVFVATGDAGTPAWILAESGDGQGGAPGEVLPEPLCARVFDTHGNPVSGVTVDFSVVAGGGTFQAGESSTTTASITSTADGRATTRLRLGNLAGQNAHIVEATFAGSTGSSARFVQSGVYPGAVEDTRLSGEVLSAAQVPVAGATVRLLAGSAAVVASTTTNAAGVFGLRGVPVGAATVVVEPPVGQDPMLVGFSYPVFLLAGHDNRLNRLVFLPRVDPAETAVVDDAREVVLSSPEIAGLTLRVAAGSAHFVDGTTQGTLFLSQVSTRRSPVALPAGARASWLWLIGPSTLRFDPGAALELPNLDGLPAGRVVEILRFDDAAGRWAVEALAVVSADGAVLQPDAGFGITRGGLYTLGEPAQRHTQITGVCGSEVTEARPVIEALATADTEAAQVVAGVILDALDGAVAPPYVPCSVQYDVEAVSTACSASASSACALAQCLLCLDTESFLPGSTLATSVANACVTACDGARDAAQSLLASDRAVARCRVLAGARAPVLDGSGVFSVPDLWGEGPALDATVFCSKVATVVASASVASAPVASATTDVGRLPPLGSVLEIGDRIRTSPTSLVLTTPSEHATLGVSTFGARGMMAGVTTDAALFSSNPEVVAVGAGEVVAAGAGEAWVGVHAQGLVAGVRVSVQLNPDRDGDGIQNEIEVARGLNPDDASDALADADGDTLSNIDEISRGTDLRSPDSDSDGVNDGDEIDRGTNPLDWDSDDDTIGDGVDNCPRVPNLDQQDGDVDGVGDACSAPRCPKSGCDDGIFCNGVETCDPVSGCQPALAPPCDDGIACTVDLCDEITGGCNSVADNGLCDDALECNGAESCDAELGCLPGAPPSTCHAPIAHYRLNEGFGATALDWSGMRHHATLTDGAGFGAGLSGSALQLDGVNDSARASFVESTPATWTLEAWIFDTQTSPGTQPIVSFSSTYTAGFYLSSSQRLALHACSPVSSAVVPQNRWSHVAATFDGTTVRYFVDGVASGEGACTPPAWNRLWIGGAGASSFGGRIDDVRVYNRALDPSEITDHASVLALHFDEGTGELAADASGLFNGGHLVGASWTAGYVGAAVHLDGLGDHVAVGANSALELGRAFTLDVWLRRDKPALGYTETVIAASDKNTSGGLRLQFNSADRLVLAVDNAGDVLISSLPISDSDWHHVRVIHAGESYALWIDGSDAGQTFSSAAPATTGLPLTLGALASGAEPFAGDLDAVRLTPFAKDAPVLAWYRFDEASGTTTKDVGGDHFDGTLVGGVTWAAGLGGAGISLDGSSGWIETTYAASAAQPAAFTAEAWIFDVGGGGTLRRLLSTSTASYSPLQLTSGDRLQVSGSGCAASTGLVASGRWTHVAAAWDGATVAYYIDGKPAGASACAPYDWNQLRIGAYSSGDGSKFGGLIDEVRLYRNARSAAQLADDASILTLHLDEGAGSRAQDASGLLNHGDVVGAVWDEGASGGALFFDGVDDVVRVADSEGLQLAGDFTMDLWLQRQGPLGIEETLISKDDGATPGGFRLYLDALDRVVFSVRGKGEVIASVTPLIDDAWHQLELTRMGDRYRLKIDDVQEASVALSDGPTPTSAALTLGSDDSGAFAGRLDEVRLLPLARRGDLLALYRFDEGSGTFTEDSSGSGFDGTLNSGAVWAPGISGTALALDGTGWADTSYPSGAGTPAVFTIEAWVKSTASYGVLQRIVVTSTAGYGLGIASNDRLYLSGSSCGSSTRLVPHDRFVHVAATWDGALLSYYIDGEPAGSVTCTPYSWNQIRIGAYSAGDSSKFKGVLDEVRVVPVAHSAAEIRDHASVLMLHFDEGKGVVAHDSSGLLNHGRIASASWVAGVAGSALAFAGVGSVTVASTSALDLSNDFAIDVHVRRDGRLGTPQTIIAKDDGSTASSWRLSFDSSNHVVFSIRNQGDVVASVRAINDTAWHRLQVRRSGATYSLLIDDIAETTVVTSISPQHTAAPLTIGVLGNGSEPLWGAVDDVRVLPRAPGDPAIIALYHMDEGSGTIVGDSGEGGFHGSLKDGAAFTPGVAGTGLALAGGWVDTLYPSTAGQPAAFTIEAWAKNTAAYGVLQRIVSTSTAGYGLGIASSDGLYFSGSSCGSSTRSVPRHRFTHLAVTWDGALLSYYIDGEPAGSVTCTPYSWNQIRIGAYAAGDSSKFQGTLDEVGIASVSKSAEEIHDRASVLMLHFDEGTGIAARDSSGLLNHGAISGATFVGGVVGSALSFDGVNDVVVVPSSSAFDFADDFSLDLQVRRDQGFGVEQTLVARGDGATPSGWRLYLDTLDRPVFAVYGAGEMLTASGSIRDSAWHRARVLRHGTRYTLVVDGVVERSVVSTIVPASTTAPLRIGGGGGEAFSGSMDELRVTPFVEASTTAVADFLFDEGTGTVTADSSGQGFNGTLMGNMSWIEGISGSGLYFDGADDYVDVLYPPTMGTPATWTIAAWVFDTAAYGTLQRLVSTSTAGYGLAINSSDRLTFSGSSCGASDTIVPRGRWAHLAATWDGSVLNYYIDGRSAGSASGCAPYGWNQLRIGAYAAGDGSKLKGSMDELHVETVPWSATSVLDAASALALHLDEGSGTKAADASGFLRHGVVSGATWTEGMTGSALAFDGVDDVVVVDDASMLDLQHGWTLEVSFQRLGESGVPEVILAKDDGISDGTWRLLLDSTGRPVFEIGGTAVIEGRAPVNDSLWHRLSVSRRGELYAVYLDGALDSEATSPMVISDTSLSLTIGNDGAGTAAFAGSIDDVRVTASAWPVPPLLLWYRFDEGGGLLAVDAAEAGFAGSLQGSPTWDSGRQGLGLRFDGALDWVSTDYPTSAGTPAQWTVEAWIHDTRGSGVLRRIVSTSTASYGALQINSNDRLYVDGCAGSTAAVPSHRFTHVAATYNGSGVSYYVDGQPAGTVACTPYAWNQVRIGAYASGDGSKFAGILDDLRIYTVARSASQIADDAALLSLHFDEGAGAVAHDSSGQRNDADVSDVAWAEGALGWGLSFAGGQSVGVIADANALDLAERFTLQAAVQVGAGTGGPQIIVAKDDDTAQGRFSFGLDAGGRPTFFMEGASVLSSAEALPNDGAFHDVVVTRAGEIFQIRVDGELVAQDSLLPFAPLAANTVPVTLGAKANGGAPFTGALDEVKLIGIALPASRLIARYRFEEGVGTTALDSSGNIYDAALQSAAWTAGHLGGGIAFDGSTWLDTPYPATAGRPTAFTVEAWIFDTQGSGLRRLVSTNSSAYCALQISSASRLLVDGSGCTSSTATVPANQWAHIAVTWDGTTLSYYVDGQPAGTVACTPYGWNQLRIGAYTSGDGSKFEGVLDEIMVWDIARSAEEILADMNGT